MLNLCWFNAGQTVGNAGPVIKENHYTVHTTQQTQGNPIEPMLS